MERYKTLSILIPYIFWGISIILIILLLYSLRKKEDERREIIVTKAAAMTLYVVIGFLLIRLLGVSFVIFGGDDIAEPITLLNTISIVYFLGLLAYKKRYGA